MQAASSIKRILHFYCYNSKTSCDWWAVDIRINLSSLKKKKKRKSPIFPLYCRILAVYLHMCFIFKENVSFLSFVHLFSSVQFSSFSSSANILTIFHMSCLLYVSHPTLKYIFLTKLAQRNFISVVPCCIVILGRRNPTRCNSMQIFIYC